MNDDENKNPFPHLYEKNSHQIHPAGNLLNGIQDPFSADNLMGFFKDAFYPNSDEFNEYSSFDEFVKIEDSKKGYSYTIENLADNRNNKVNYNILDLAAGNTLFLKQLLYQHGPNACSEQKCVNFLGNVTKKVTYVAVDKGFTPQFIESVENLFSKYEKCFEFIHHPFDVSKTKDLNYLEYTYKENPFDLIIFSNSLHEISPEAWPIILSTIFNLLNKDGYFVFLDLINPMALESIKESFKRFVSGQSYWEANAVYCYKSDIQELITKIGFDGISKIGFDHDIPYWCFKVKKDGALTPERKEALFSFISKKFIKKHLQEWKTKSQEERENVIKVFRTSNDQYISIFTALRYLCRCASDTRTRECLKSFNLKEIISKKIIK